MLYFIYELRGTLYIYIYYIVQNFKETRHMFRVICDKKHIQRTQQKSGYNDDLMEMDDHQPRIPCINPFLRGENSWQSLHCTHPIHLFITLYSWTKRVQFNMNGSSSAASRISSRRRES